MTSFKSGDAQTSSANDARMNVQAVAQVKSGRKRVIEFVWPNQQKPQQLYPRKLPAIRNNNEALPLACRYSQPMDGWCWYMYETFWAASRIFCQGKLGI